MSVKKFAMVAFGAGFLALAIFLGGFWLGGQTAKTQFDELMEEYDLVPKQNANEVEQVVMDICDMFGFQYVENETGTCD